MARSSKRSTTPATIFQFFFIFVYLNSDRRCNYRQHNDDGNQVKWRDDLQSLRLHFKHRQHQNW